jgi:hypothetical protein
MSANTQQILKQMLWDCGLEANPSFTNGFMIFSGAYCVGVVRAFKDQGVLHLPDSMHKEAEQVLATQYLYQPAFCSQNAPPLLPQQLKCIQQFLEALNAQEAAQ